MATGDQQDRASASRIDGGAELDALPMNKSGPVGYIAAGVGVLVVGGLLVFALGGKGEGEAKAKPESAEKQAASTEGLSKEELKARQEHLLRTQEALAAAEKEEAGEKAETAPAAPEEPAPTARKSTASSSSSTAPAKKPVNKQKSLDSLDSLGSDITSQLK